MHQRISQEMAAFIQASPTAFHAVASIAAQLEAAGFVRLEEGASWSITRGGRYYVTRNGSSLIAWQVGERLQDYNFQILASHSDSPAFKLKENAQISVGNHYTMLNTEGYGGMLCAPWFDRPLSIAGRVLVQEEEQIVTRLLHLQRDLLLIPSLAIHMNREANNGQAYNKQKDMLPLFGGKALEPEALKNLLAEELQVEPSAILGSDLFVYNPASPSLWGIEQEFISSPRLDDLQCAYGSLQGFLQGSHRDTITVYACFDNEEVGSGTGQGAASTFMREVLTRINTALGKSREDYYRALAGGMLLSCDNAHAVHPNHPEKTDATNCVYMNQGVVIKSHAGQKYTSDGVSIALFKSLCRRAGVPVQHFANRSDAQGGSTLGNIAMTQVSVKAVDIGLAQLAMHSAYETAGTKDTAYLVQACRAFCSTRIRTLGNGSYTLEE